MRISKLVFQQHSQCAGQDCQQQRKAWQNDYDDVSLGKAEQTINCTASLLAVDCYCSPPCSASPLG